MWSQDITTLGLQTDDPLYKWLSMPGILSVALKKVCNELTVKVISQQLAMALPDEQQVLNIFESNSLIREVYLCGDGVPWVYAKTVVPNECYLQHKNILDNLGTQLLGESFLFKEKNVNRGSFYYAALNVDILNLEKYFIKAERELYARRSRFQLGENSLLVIETFLQSIPTAPT